MSSLPEELGTSNSYSEPPTVTVSSLLDMFDTIDLVGLAKFCFTVFAGDGMEFWSDEEEHTGRLGSTTAFMHFGTALVLVSVLV